MNERVLVAFDGSPPATRAARFAAEHFADADILLVTVVDPYDSLHGAYGGVDLFGSQRPDDTHEEAMADLEEVVELFDDTSSVTTEVGMGRPAHTILDYAEKNEVDHIVLGSHGREGAERVLLGSVAETVLRRASVPVTVVR